MPGLRIEYIHRYPPYSPNHRNNFSSLSQKSNLKKQSDTNGNLDKQLYLFDRKRLIIVLLKLNDTKINSFKMVTFLLNMLTSLPFQNQLNVINDFDISLSKEQLSFVLSKEKDLFLNCYLMR